MTFSSRLFAALIFVVSVKAMIGAEAPVVDSGAGLQRLGEGNARFIAGGGLHPNQTVARRSEVAAGQHPFASVLTCADSRVGPEVIFDQGLGDIFTVRVAGVAEEVRSLAQRSAQAAKESAAKIEESVARSEHGVSVSAQVSDSLLTMVQGAREVDSLVAEIATASGEQHQGVGQVNTAVSQMDKITQSNAANSEECAAAAEELSAQSVELDRLVGEIAKLIGSRSGPASSMSETGVAHAPKKHSVSNVRLHRADRVARRGSNPVAQPVGR